MNKKLTHEEFLERLYEKNDLYRNGEIKIIGKYKGEKNIIKIKYKGDYYSSKPKYLLLNNTPTIITAIFKESLLFKKFKQTHNNKYKYPDFKYINVKQKINIICPEHGIFKQKLNNHLSGQGCNNCGYENRKLKYKEVIIRFKQTHNNKYKYPDFKYINVKQKINIICPEHGVFKQKINNHLSGQGCNNCGYENRNENRKLKYQEIINRFNKIHVNKYKYSDFKYENTNQYIHIECPEHGLFKQKLNNHLSGQGCRKCGHKYKKNRNKYNFKYNFKYKFLKLYFLKLYSDTEKFYKIGITSNTLKSRFGTKINDYKYKKIYIIEGNSQEIIDLEYKIKKDYKQYQYIPEFKFDGYTECFSKNLFELFPELFKVKPPLLLTE